SDFKLTFDIFLHATRHTNASRLGNPLKTRRHVHAISEDVTVVDDDVTDMDADAELDPFLLRHVGIALGHTLLNISRAAHCIDNAAELSQQAIAGGLDNTPTVLRDLRFEQRAQVILKLGVRSLLIQASQAAVASHIGREDGCKLTLYAVSDGQGSAPGFPGQLT